MKKNQIYNNNNNNNNYTKARTNYINPISKNKNINLYQNQPSSTIANTSNSIAFSSSLSNNNMNFDNRQLDSSNLSKQYEDFSKTLSNQTLDNSNNYRDSKAVKIKNITKRPDINNNINERNKVNLQKKSQMARPNISNTNQNKQFIRTNIDKGKINQNIEKNKEDDSDESSDYGNADDDDFDNILRESINIRNTQSNLNMNNNPNFKNNLNQNPFPGKQKNIIGSNKNKGNTNEVLKNKNIKNQVNNGINKNMENIQQINKKITEEKNNVINNLENMNLKNEINYKKDEMKNIINNNLNKNNPISNETENKAYNVINNYFNKIDLESDKKDANLNKIDLDLNNMDLINENNLKQNANNIKENLNNFKKNINEQNFVKLDDYFDNNELKEENILNNLNNNINNNNRNNNMNNNINENLNIINLNDYFGNNDLNQENQNDILNNINNDINNNLNNIKLDNYFGNNNLNQENKNDLNNTPNVLNNALNFANNLNINHNLNDINFGNIENLTPEESDINRNNLNSNNYISADSNSINNNNNIINNNISNNFFFEKNNNIPTPIHNSKIDFENPETKNQIINHNISIDNMLKEIKFLQRLKSISDERYSYFIKKYQKDNYFMEKTQYENIFIDEKNIQVQSPLTLIFHYIFNPDTLLPESGKSFFETIFTKRGDQNYSMSYEKSELLEVPKYFDNFSYVNNLFNTFNKHDLNLFLEEINTWKETFSFEQQFKHPLYMFRREKSITMKDVAIVYFISPYDLIIDYHSYGSELPLSDTFIAITQYRFHCDIKFDNKKGKFAFKTSGKIFNTIKFVKETLLKKAIRNESNNTNKEELQVNTWSPLKNVIDSEDKKNQKIANDIYEKYLMNNLYKYSKELPKEYDIFNVDNEENWDSFSDASDEIGQINNKEQNLLLDWKKDLEDRNFVILFYVGLCIVLLLLSKILWSIWNGTFSFGSLFNTFIVFLLGYILIKFK